MKILPINDIAWNFHASNSNKLNYNNSSTYNITDLSFLNKSYKQVNFKGLPLKESLKFIQQLPLEDRLASIFEKADIGDLILTGKKLNDAKIKMLECAKDINTHIKRVFYIPDEKLRGYLGFFINKDGDKEVFNLNNFDIKLRDSETLKPDILKPNNSYYVHENDFISLPTNKNYPLQIKTKSKTDLSNYRKNFCKAVDFSKGINSEVEKLNRKVLVQLSREVKEASSKVTFKDVGGQDALITELKRSILFPIKYPEMYESFDVNKGFILYGPPGTGKTHIARALANEADANFISLNGLEMESKWVGESEENWRTLFQEAKEKQPTIMFIDELDAVGKSRDSADVHGNKVVNQMLTLISDLDESRDNIFIIGATNNFKALDKALIRSGRLSKHIEVKLPDLEGIKQIFDIHSAKKPLDRNLDKNILIQKLFELKTSGSDIRYIINEAHLAGYDRAGIHEKMENGTITGKDKHSFWITKEDFDKAIQKFIETRNGTERKSIGFNK